MDLPNIYDRPRCLRLPSTYDHAVSISDGLSVLDLGTVLAAMANF